MQLSKNLNYVVAMGRTLGGSQKEGKLCREQGRKCPKPSIESTKNKPPQEFCSCPFLLPLPSGINGLLFYGSMAHPSFEPCPLGDVSLKSFANSPEMKNHD